MDWSQILNELHQNNHNVDVSTLTLINQSPRIFVMGAGRSGLAIRAFAMRLAQMGKPTFVVGETTTPAIQSTDLLIVASSSGQTSQLVNAVNTATEVGATIWLWSTNNDNPIAHHAQKVTLLAGKNKYDTELNQTQQPLGSLFEQSVWLFGDLFVMQYMAKYNVNENNLKQRHANLE
jgi:6-phospho-3-hexuloisomerase